MADGVAAWFNTVEYDAADLRSLAGAMLLGGGQVLPRAGKRPGAGLEVTVGGTPEAVTVQPGCAVVTDGSTTAYVVVVDSAASVDLATRPSTGQSRVDLVIARVYDADVHGDTSLREVDVEVVTGTASSGTPTAPSLPAGALQLAKLTVPATGSVSVAGAAQRTVAAGGILPVAGTAERAAIASPYKGQAVYREDTDVIEVYDGTGWAAYRRTQTGTVPVSATIAANSSTTVSVSFGATLPYVPTYCDAVMSTFAAGAGAVIVRQCDSITASGFRIVLYNTSAATVTFSGAVYSWVAVA